MKYKNYDCLDIGADVNSMSWCKDYLGVTNPIGLNIEESRLTNMRNAGLPCENVNAFDLSDDVRVDYIFMSHLLEHLQTAQQVTDLVSKCIRMARKGIYIAGPFFEDDTYIRTHDLKFVWGDWIDHISRFSIYNFLPYLRHTIGEKTSISLGFPVFNSIPDNIVAIDERPNISSFATDSTKDKKDVVFTRPVFQEFLVFIQLDPSVDNNRIHEARHGKQGRAAWCLWENAEVLPLRSIYEI